jgi:hypothetical protein
MKQFPQPEPLTDAELDSAPITLGVVVTSGTSRVGQVGCKMRRFGDQEGNPDGSLFGSPFRQSAQED